MNRLSTGNNSIEMRMQTMMNSIRNAIGDKSIGGKQES